MDHRPTPLPPTASSALGTGLSAGLGAAVAAWCVWFCLQIPDIRSLNGAVGGAVLIATLCSVMVWRLRAMRGGVAAGLVAGLSAGAANLLWLGAHLGNESPNSSGSRPDARLIVLGFLAISALLGLGAGFVASRFPRDGAPKDWLAELGAVVAAAIAPLLFIGGLVTSTESGMAVPDWPTTYGGNMFLYPIGLMADHRIFLEHAHRLFGTLAGFCSIALVISALFRAHKGRVLSSVVGFVLVAVSVAIVAVNRAEHLGAMPAIGGLGAVFVISTVWIVAAVLGGCVPATVWALLVLVLVQGTLGGVRVTANEPLFATLHGVGGQIVFACAVAIAARLASDASPIVRAPDAPRPAARFAAVTLGLLFIQLVFGAMFRHMESMHALWSHAGFAFVVVACVLVLAAFCTRTGSAPLRRVGAGLITCVIVQFLLGWLALWLVLSADDRGAIPTSEELGEAPVVPLGETLVATAHQANGALVLALTTLAAVWSRNAR